MSTHNNFFVTFDRFLYFL